MMESFDFEFIEECIITKSEEADIPNNILTVYCSNKKTFNKYKTTINLNNNAKYFFFTHKSYKSFLINGFIECKKSLSNMEIKYKNGSVTYKFIDISNIVFIFNHIDDELNNVTFEILFCLEKRKIEDEFLFLKSYIKKLERKIEKNSKKIIKVNKSVFTATEKQPFPENWFNTYYHKNNKIYRWYDVIQIGVNLGVNSPIYLYPSIWITEHKIPEEKLKKLFMWVDMPKILLKKLFTNKPNVKSTSLTSECLPLTTNTTTDSKESCEDLVKLSYFDSKDTLNKTVPNDHFVFKPFMFSRFYNIGVKTKLLIISDSYIHLDFCECKKIVISITPDNSLFKLHNPGCFYCNKTSYLELNKTYDFGYAENIIANTLEIIGCSFINLKEKIDENKIKIKNLRLIRVDSLPDKELFEVCARKEINLSII
jgi:hypothetical protein